MAKVVKYAVKKKGYQQAMNASGVQLRLQRYADQACGGATAKTNAHGHEGLHFDDRQIQGRFAKGWLVHPTTNEGSAHAREALAPYASSWK